MTVHVAGIDVSLTRTGVAVWREGWRDPRVASFPSAPQGPKPTLVQRMGRTQASAIEVIRFATFGIEEGDLCLFNLEAPLYVTPTKLNPATGRREPIRGGGHQHDRSMLWGFICNGVMRYGLPAETATTTLKSFVASVGSGRKAGVLAAIGKQFPAVTIHNDDEADAVGLAWMGAHHLGIDPVPRNPRPNLAALDSVRWPLRERKN